MRDQGQRVWMRSCRWGVSSAPYPGALEATLRLPSTVLSKLRRAHQSPGDLVQNADSNPGGLVREAYEPMFLTSSRGNWTAHPQPSEWQGPGEFQIPGAHSGTDSDRLGLGPRAANVPLVFVSSYCWGSLFLIPGLVTIVVDKIERDWPGRRGGISCRGGRRGHTGMNKGFRAKNTGSNLSSIISNPQDGIETWSLS